ncbi:MAG: hypothetical protein KGN97_03965 [Bacteroidota bacterium]|nr:hypothetical protein [Bacteroidota bacterium]
MNSKNLSFIIAILSILILTNCTKNNGIDNNSVIVKPYVLYFSGDRGELFKTNTGRLFNLVFPPDGYPCDAIATSYDNLFFIKRNVHISVNNGKTFDSSTVSAQVPFAQQIIDVPAFGKLYVGSMLNKLSVSTDHGKTWNPETAWDVAPANPISSLTQTANGTVFALEKNNNTIFYKVNAGANWAKQAPNNLPAVIGMYLTHAGNTLIATDRDNANGIWQSVDNGVTWGQIAGLPNRKLYATNCPFDATLLVGTDSMGIYRMESGSFVASNNGILKNTSVYGIIGKEDIYKNSASKKYIYIATSTGLYRSDDLGKNWTLMKQGIVTTVY